MNTGWLKSQLINPGIFLLSGMLLNAAMIIAAARGDLWFDEIWSISFAEAARTPWEIVSSFKHDNNHILNTLFLYVIGRQDNLMLYRLFAVMSGIGSMAMLITIAKKWSHGETIFVLLLAGTSYPLILYFSEARGYAPAMFLALTSLYLTQGDLSHIRPRRMVLFWLTAVLGTLSHFTYVIVFLSLMIYMFANAINERSTLRTTARHLASYFAVPLVFISAFYLYFISGMVIGGGPEDSMFTEINRGAASLLGLPDSLVSTKLPIIISAALTLSAVYVLYRERNVIWTFYFSVLVLLPWVILFMAKPVYFHFRYLILCFPFFYLLMSHIFGKLYRTTHHSYRYFLIIVMTLFVIGQAQRLLPLFELGRGNYRAIVSEISQKSSGNILKVGSDHDFRTSMLLYFYSRFLPPHQSLHYIEQSSWSTELPEWIITHSTVPSYKPLPYLVLPDNQIYQLTKVEDFSGNSGFGWFLYHHRP